MNTLVATAALLTMAGGRILFPGPAELYSSNDLAGPWAMVAEFTNSTPIPAAGAQQFFRARVKGPPVEFLGFWRMTNTAGNILWHGRATKVLTNILLSSGVQVLDGYQTRREMGLNDQHLPVVRWVDFAFPPLIPAAAQSVVISVWDLEGFRAVSNCSSAVPLDGAALQGTDGQGSSAPPDSSSDYHAGDYVPISYAFNHHYWEKMSAEWNGQQKTKNAWGSVGATNAALHMDDAGACSAYWTGPGGSNIHVALSQSQGDCYTVTPVRWFQAACEFADWTTGGSYGRGSIQSDDLREHSGSATLMYSGNKPGVTNVVLRVSVLLYTVDERYGDEVLFDATDASPVWLLGGTQVHDGSAYISVPNDVWFDVSPTFHNLTQGWYLYGYAVDRKAMSGEY